MPDSTMTIQHFGCTHSRFSCFVARTCGEKVGHTWEVDENDADNYHCTNCCAFGYADHTDVDEAVETAHLESPADPVVGDDSFPNDDVTVDDDAIESGELAY